MVVAAKGGLMDDEIATTAEAHEASAMPCARVIHANPNAPVSAEQKPLPAALSQQAGRPEKPRRMGL